MDEVNPIHKGQEKKIFFGLTVMKALKILERSLCLNYERVIVLSRLERLSNLAGSMYYSS